MVTVMHRDRDNFQFLVFSCKATTSTPMRAFEPEFINFYPLFSEHLKKQTFESPDNLFLHISSKIFYCSYFTRREDMRKTFLDVYRQQLCCLLFIIPLHLACAQGRPVTRRFSHSPHRFVLQKSQNVASCSTRKARMLQEFLSLLAEKENRFTTATTTKRTITTTTTIAAIRNSTSERKFQQQIS